MNPISLSAARNSLGGLVNRASVGGERVPISRNGRPVAYIVSAEDVARLQELEDRADNAAADAAVARNNFVKWGAAKKTLKR